MNKQTLKYRQLVVAREEGIRGIDKKDEED